MRVIFSYIILLLYYTKSSINILILDNLKLSCDYLIGRNELKWQQSCGELLWVKHLLIHCRIHTDVRSNLDLLDNLYESLMTKTSRPLSYFLNWPICIVLFKNECKFHSI
jgi:hypothetical protein